MHRAVFTLIYLRSLSPVNSEKSDYFCVIFLWFPAAICAYLDCCWIANEDENLVEEVDRKDWPIFLLPAWWRNEEVLSS